MPDVLRLGSGVDFLPTVSRGAVRQLYTDTIDNVLYAVGNFVSIGGVKCYGVAKWNGQTWDSLGSGIRQSTLYDNIQNIKDIVRYKNEIYICGAFTTCGGKNITGIARWNGLEWNNVGGDLQYASIGNLPSGNKMEVYQNELYFSGSFTSIGNNSAKAIAKWNGQTWTNLSQNFPINANIFAIHNIVHYKNELHIAGNFNFDGNVPHEQILKKVGNSWVQVGAGLNGDAWIFKLRVFQNNLYAGGYFFVQNNNPENSIFYTDGVNSFPMAGGLLPATVTDMFEYENELYICGQINFAGTLPINRIVKWDGTQWLYVNISVNLGTTLPYGDGTLLTFAKYNGKLIMGGGFTNINGVIAYNIASVDFGTSGIQNLKPNSIFKIYPNPTNTTFTVQAKDFAQLESIQVYNALGQLVLTQKAEIENMIDVSGFSKGLYMVEVRTDKGVAREKLMVE